MLLIEKEKGKEQTEGPNRTKHTHTHTPLHTPTQKQQNTKQNIINKTKLKEKNTTAYSDQVRLRQRHRTEQMIIKWVKEVHH